MSLHLDPNEELTKELRAAWRVLRPPAKHFCRICGAEREGPEQVDVTALGSAFSTTIDGPYRKPCPTPKCGQVCKICRRDIGDVHGPDCGPLMFTKLERPHIITKEDCR